MLEDKFLELIGQQLYPEAKGTHEELCFPLRWHPNNKGKTGRFIAKEMARKLNLPSFKSENMSPIISRVAYQIWEKFQDEMKADGCILENNGIRGQPRNKALSPHLITYDWLWEKKFPRMKLDLDQQKAFSVQDVEPDVIEHTKALDCIVTARNSTKKSLQSRILIRYERNAKLDATITQSIYQALKQQHQVFVSQTAIISMDRAKQIEQEIQQSDFIILLLSEQSINSEMLLTEVELAHRFAKRQNGHPMILPVRLGYSGTFPYPLRDYLLEHTDSFFCQDTRDTPQLVEKLQQAIAGNQSNLTKPQTKQIKPPTQIPTPVTHHPYSSAQPTSMETPEGTMDRQSAFYVERQYDLIALKTIKEQGVTITIKGSRQIGKSSLLIRTIEAARSVGKRVAFLDFQLFEQTALSNAELFFRQFATWVTDKLELTNKVGHNNHWKAHLGNSQCCTDYMECYLLKELGQPLVLAMDEVERLFGTDFRSDFFGMLRSWHNNRAINPIWKQLDLALVTSTQPYLLIDNLNQSPFNVGQVMQLEDFTPAQVADLNQRHNSPFNPQELQQLIELLNGHPYLIRLALYLVAYIGLSPRELFSNAIADGGPFSNHLRNYLFLFHRKPELVQGMLQVVYQKTCEDEIVFFRLRGAGLVRRQGRTVLPRCQLYSNFFQENLRG